MLLVKINRLYNRFLRPYRVQHAYFWMGKGPGGRKLKDEIIFLELPKSPNGSSLAYDPRQPVQDWQAE